MLQKESPKNHENPEESFLNVAKRNKTIEETLHAELKEHGSKKARKREPEKPREPRGELLKTFQNAAREEQNKYSKIARKREPEKPRQPRG